MGAATISAIAGVAGAGMSIAGGAAAKRRAKDAARASAAALEEARKTIEVNEQEGVQVPLDSYEMAMRETTAQQEQALAALTEADSRSLAAGVGKLAAAGGNAIERQRQAMGQDIYKRDQAVAAEEANINDQLSSVSIQEAMGAQAAAQDAEQQATYAMSQGVAAGLGAGVNAYKASGLYNKDKSGDIVDGVVDGAKYVGGKVVDGVGKLSQYVKGRVSDYKIGKEVGDFNMGAIDQAKFDVSGNPESSKNYTGTGMFKDFKNNLFDKDYSSSFTPLNPLDQYFRALPNPSIKK
jgi:hypothetical protein